MLKTVGLFTLSLVLFVNCAPAHIPKPPKILQPKAVHLDEYSDFPTPTTTETSDYTIFGHKKIQSTTSNYNPNEFEKEQNRNAKYEFSSNIDDKISDLTHARTEVRNGVNVEGSYSYSDGFHKRTVKYVADEKGFRITGEQIEPLDGPKIDLNGVASVSNAAHGARLAYRVQSVPVPGPVAKIID